MLVAPWTRIFPALGLLVFLAGFAAVFLRQTSRREVRAIYLTLDHWFILGAAGAVVGGLWVLSKAAQSPTTRTYVFGRSVAAVALLLPAFGVASQSPLAYIATVAPGAQPSCGTVFHRQAYGGPVNLSPQETRAVGEYCSRKQTSLAVGAALLALPSLALFGRTIRTARAARGSEKPSRLPAC